MLLATSAMPVIVSLLCSGAREAEEGAAQLLCLLATIDDDESVAQFAPASAVKPRQVLRRLAEGSGVAKFQALTLLKLLDASSSSSGGDVGSSTGAGSSSTSGGGGSSSGSNSGGAGGGHGVSGVSNGSNSTGGNGSGSAEGGWDPCLYCTMCGKSPALPGVKVYECTGCWSLRQGRSQGRSGAAAEKAERKEGEAADPVLALRGAAVLAVQGCLQRVSAPGGCMTPDDHI